MIEIYLKGMGPRAMMACVLAIAAGLVLAILEFLMPRSKMFLLCIMRAIFWILLACVVFLVIKITYAR